MPQPSDRLFNLVLSIGYSLVALVMLAFHEPWRDEAQSWLIARDLSLGEVFHQMRYEGTPALWHLLQFPLAKLGLPFIALGALNALIASAAVALLAFRSPFSRWQKVAFACSFYVLYEYGIVWRCYSLSMLLMFAVASVYSVRTARPLLYATAVALLAQTNVQCLGLALLLLIGFIAELKLMPRGTVPTADSAKHRLLSPAAAIMLAGLAVGIWQVRPPADGMLHGMFQFRQWKEPLQMVRDTFLADQAPWGMAIYLACLLVFLIMLWDLRRHRVALMLVVLTFAGWSYLFIFKTAASPRHHGLFMLTCVMAIWIARRDGLSNNVACIHRSSGRARRYRITLAECVVFASLTLSIPYAITKVIEDVQEPFSGAEELADFLRSRKLPTTLVAHDSAKVAAVLPYIPEMQLLALETGNKATFVTWSQEYRKNNRLTSAEILSRTSALGASHWLILTSALDSPVPNGYRLLFQNRKMPLGHGSSERFWVYEPMPRN